MRPPTPTCSDCGNRIAKSRAKRCRPCYNKHRLNGKPRAPRTICEDCGAECRGSLCGKCQRRTYDASEIELTGGRWLRRGNRLVWVSVEEEIAEYTRRHEARTRPHAPGLDCCCCTGDLSRGLARRTLDGWMHAQGCAA